MKLTHSLVLIFLTSVSLWTNFLKEIVLRACSPVVLDPSSYEVFLSSKDLSYSPGNIIYRNCSQSQIQRPIGWCPNPHDLSPNVTVDLKHFQAVYGIMFQNMHASCTPGKDNYSLDAFLATFDLEYIIAGDPEENWVSYDKDLLALTSSGSERMFEFAEPLVTAAFRIIPNKHNIYPCFRLAVTACDPTDLCPASWCLNGGKCSGQNQCTCSSGFYGERCNNSINNIEIENYSFLRITNNILETPDATFDVVGNVTMGTYRKRHHDHDHYVNCQGQNSYFQYRSGYDHHHYYHGHGHHRRSHHHHGSCMSNLDHHSHGFTTSMNVNYGHNSGHHSHHHIYSNGGNLPGCQGASLHYSNNQLHFQVQSSSHQWSVSAPCQLQNNTWNHIQTSWHPQTGVSLYVNNQHIGSSSNANPNPSQYTQTIPLRMCNGHQNNINVNVNVNLQISGLSMIPVGQHQLSVAGLQGPYTVPPPQPLPSTTQPTTRASTTTQQKVSATTTLQSATTTTMASTSTPTTTPTGPHRSVCYSCTSQSSLGSCQNKVQCQVGEVCTLFQDRSGYTSKCLDKQVCLDGKRVAATSCWECCESYLCNDNCQANGNVTCADQPACATLMITGFDVCKDPKMSVDVCRKSCNKC